MPAYDFKCKKCKKVFEYNTNESLPKEFHPPDNDKCVECGGELKKLFSAAGQSFDIIGYCYENVYGKKNWKSHHSFADQAKILSGEKDPY